MKSDGILTGPAIAEAVQQGRIFIENYDPSRLNPASYDLTLGNQVAVYALGIDTRPEGSPEDGSNLRPHKSAVLNALDPGPVFKSSIDPKIGWVLQPGIGYLMHTAERICTNHYVPVLDGKSTIGRLFIQVHVTAGYIDPGFDGQITLEVVVTHPIRVYPGMRICQVRFHTVQGKVSLYAGRYKNGRATGAVPAEVSGLLQTAKD